MRAPSSRTRKLARLSAGPIAVLLASGIVWQGSMAAFTATTSNDGNSWSMGEAGVELTDDSAGTAMFNVQNVLPGQTGKNCISVTADSTLPGEVRFYLANVSTNTALTERLFLTVERGTGGSFDDCTGFTPEPGASRVGDLYFLGDAISDYRSGMVSWTIDGTSSESATYRITWRLSSSITADEFATMQGQSVNADLVWELQTAAPDAPAS